MIGVIIVIIGYAIALFALFAGKALGERKRRSTMRQLTQDSTQVPAYELPHNLQPLEVELLYSGRISANGIAGQLVKLSQQYCIAFQPSSSQIYLQRLPEITDGKTDILYKLLATNQLTRKPRSQISFNKILAQIDDIHARTRSSLKRSDLQLHESHKLDTENPPLKIATPLIVSAILPFIALIVLVILRSPDDNETIFGILLILGPLAVVLSLGGIALWILYSNARNAYGKRSAIITQVREKHPAVREEIQRLYRYLEVSGADQFTPDSSSMNFSDMDELYPYWVALGFDAELVKTLNRS